MAGAVFGEIWNDIAGARNVVFFHTMLVKSANGNLGCEAGCGLTVSCSEQSRIGRALKL